jgi:hypothetical protein
MPYCARCGVEVDVGIEACPLCLAPIPTFDDLPPLGGSEIVTERRYPPLSAEKARAMGQQIRLSIWAAFMAIFVISFLVVLTANLIETGGQITWSGYALGSIGLTGIIATIILVIFRPPWLLVLCSYLPTIGFLALVDVLDGSFDWFLGVGLPIASSTFLAFEISTIIWTVWKDRGANQLGILLALIGLACVGVDLVTAIYFDRPGLSWSYVVLGVLIPLAGFLFIYHYALRKVLKLERFFHV